MHKKIERPYEIDHYKAMRVPEVIVHKVIHIANELRKHGVNVGISEVVTALRMYETYTAIAGKRVHDYNALYTVLKAVFTKRDRDEKVFDNIIKHFHTEGVVKDLIKQTAQTLRVLGLRYDDRVYSKRKLLKGKTREERKSKLEAYTTLKKLGLIYHDDSGRERVVSKQQAETLFRKILTKTYAKSLPELAQKVWEEKIRKIPSHKIRDYTDIISAHMLSTETLSSLSLSKLLEVAKVLEKTGNKRALREALDEIVRRLEIDYDIKTLSYNDLVDLLIRHKRVDEKTIALLISKYPKTVDKLLKASDNALNVLRNILPQLPVEEQTEIIKKVTSAEKLIKPQEMRDLLKLVSPYAFKGISHRGISKLSPLENLLVRSLSGLARAYEYSVEAFKSGNVGYINMALREYENAVKLYNDYRRQVASYKDGRRTSLDYDFLRHLEHNYSILEILVKPSLTGDSCSRLIDSILLYSLSEVTYVKMIRELSLLYNSVIDERVKNEILVLASRIAHKLRDKLKSYAIASKRKISTRRAHSVAIRRTIYNLVRYHVNILYRSKKKESKIILVVDTSGSMRDYAEWAILMSSALSQIVSHIILFSHNITVYEREALKNMRNTVKILFNLKFYGWTDIIKALEKAEQIAAENRIRHIVVITDLKQTIKRHERVEDRVEKLIKKRLKVVFIIPPLHDRKVASLLRDLGVKVLSLKDARALPKAILSLIS